MSKKFNVYLPRKNKWQKIGVGKVGQKSIRLWFFREVPLREWLLILKSDVFDRKDEEEVENIILEDDET
ncbi:MAG: hypothetical protein QXO44_03300 [Thermoplasmatales archaeon]